MEILATIDDTTLVKGTSKKSGKDYYAIRVAIGDEYKGMIFLSKWELMYIKEVLNISE